MCRRRICAATALVFLGIGTSRAQELTATLRQNVEWRSGQEVLEFVLNRPLTEGEQVTLLVGTTDVTDLCNLVGDTLRYRPLRTPLPRGAVSVSVFLVTPDGAWTQVGSGTVNVLTVGGLEDFTVGPSITLSYNGQPAEDHDPESSGPSRSRFHELNGQLAFKTELERGGIRLGAGANVVGVSFHPEALRFSELGTDAPKIDLAEYRVETHWGRTNVMAGHVAHGRSRHLLNGFSSRGVSFATAIGGVVDLSGAILNGTNIVGWKNLFGMSNPRHRIYSGTLGLEILAATPGTLRIEGSYVHGSQLPRPSFGQSRIDDAEQSNGGSLRLLCSDPGRTISLDAGLTITRFVNPLDPLLAQGNDIVPVVPVTRRARYADISWNVIRDEMILGSVPAQLSAAFRHERMDPLFRAVGANVRADFLSNMVDVQGMIGPLQFGVTHLWSEDNLGELASVLKSKTRQSGLNLAFTPGGSVFPAGLPTVSYALACTHQFGVSLPTNSEFTPDLVPDQVTTTHSTGFDWGGELLRCGYRGAYTTQDNRQPGRENADAVNRTNALNLTIAAARWFAASMEASLESNENTESGVIQRSRRIGANLSLLPWSGLTTLLTASRSVTEPDDHTSRQQQTQMMIESSYEFDFTPYVVFRWRGRVFARYSWNEAHERDNVFDVSSRSRAWVIHTGLSLNFF